MSDFTSQSEIKSTSTYTNLDAWLKEIPELKEKIVHINLGKLTGSKRLSQRSINRIIAPLDSVHTLDDLSVALHKVEENAKKLQIFHHFNVNIPSMNFSDQTNMVNVNIDVDCEEKKLSPTFNFRTKRNTFGQLELDSLISITNLLGESEQFQLIGTTNLNSRHTYEFGAGVFLPLLDYQGLKNLSLFYGLGKEAISQHSIENGTPFSHLKVSANLIGNHQLEWNYKKRGSTFQQLSENKLNSLTYKYFWDKTRKNAITGIREKGIYSDIECTMASFNSSPRFVKSRFSTHTYVPLNYKSAVASLHLQVSGLQPLNTDYSAANFSKINDSIHPMDRLYTNVRGFDSVGLEKQLNDSKSVTEPIGGNFALNVEGKITMPLKFLNIIYDLTNIHGQAFIQAGNTIPLDFEKGDIERAQKQFVQSTRASYGIGAFISLENLRLELNYSRRLNLGIENDNSFSSLQFNVATEF